MPASHGPDFWVSLVDLFYGQNGYKVKKMSANFERIYAEIVTSAIRQDSKDRTLTSKAASEKGGLDQ
jgi:hypothetical protein